VEHKPLEVAETLGQDTPPDGSPAEIAAGARIGRYIVLHRLGAGGMGVVYVAFDPELDRKVAIKLLRTDLSHAGDEARQRLLREAQALARVSHPNVIAVHDVGTYAAPDGERVFLAMEYVEGQTLRKWLPGRTREEILEVFRLAGRGLAAAHEAGIIHRDFKPENVLVSVGGWVRVLDFGLARAAGFTETAAQPGEAARPVPGDSGPLQTPMTRAGALLGTPWYMAPEQRARKAVNAGSDQFSFCVTLYEALYGERPFADAPVNQEPDWTVRPPARRVPGWIRRILVRGLSVDPAQRFPSMEALLDALAHDPVRRQRRLALVGLSTLAVLAVVGVLANNRAHLCGGAGDKLTGVWDAPRRKAVRDAFLATKLPFAARSFEAVASTLDRYGALFVAHHTEACAATRVRGEQSEELLDLRMRCLDARLAEVRGLVVVFAHSDPKVVERSVQAGDSLTPLATCADRATLTTRKRPPREARDRIDVLTRQLASAKALFFAGKYKDAAVPLPAIVSAARQIGYRPLEAEALLLTAQIDREANDVKAAGANGFAALTAAEAADDDAQVVEAAVHLVWLTGYLENHFADAHRWDAFADSVLERLGRPARLQMLRDRALGLVLRVESKNAEAVDAQRRALALSEKLDAEGTDVARDLAGLSTTLQLMDRLDEALTVSARAVAIFQARLGPDHPTTATAVETLGNCEFSLGRFDDALSHLQQSCAVKERAHGAGHPWTELCHVEIADTLLELGRLDEAAALLDAALQALQKAVGDKHAMLVYPLQVTGHLERQRHRLPEAVAADERALAVATTALGAQHLAVADSLLALGRDHLAAGHPDRAVPPLEKALVIREANPTDANPLAQVRFTLAQALGRSPRALELAQKAADTFAQAPWRKRDGDAVAAWLKP
jgi:tetratricopeptide (TPR) repeat protein